MASAAIPDIAVTPPSALAELNAIAAQDEAKGQVPVHTFDPNAPPEVKAAQAAQGEEKLKRNKDDKGAGGVGGYQLNVTATSPDALAEVPVDTGKANVLPTITIEDVDKANEAAEPPAPLQEQPPGAMPAGPAPVIPDWYKVGWRAAVGLDDPAVTEGEAKDKSVLDAFLSEQFYGEWYHNAALIVVVSLVYRRIIHTQKLTRFSGGHCHPLPHALRSGLGMAVHCPRCLQHLLLDLHGPCQTPSS